MKMKLHAFTGGILLVALVLGCATTGGYGTMSVVEGGGMTV